MSDDLPWLASLWGLSWRAYPGPKIDIETYYPIDLTKRGAAAVPQRTPGRAYPTTPSPFAGIARAVEALSQHEPRLGASRWQP